MPANPTHPDAAPDRPNAVNGRACGLAAKTATGPPPLNRPSRFLDQARSALTAKEHQTGESRSSPTSRKDR